VSLLCMDSLVFPGLYSLGIAKGYREQKMRLMMVGWFPPKRVVLRPCSYPFAFANQVKPLRIPACMRSSGVCMHAVCVYVCLQDACVTPRSNYHGA
jgi:hypothetical protein